MQSSQRTASARASSRPTAPPPHTHASHPKTSLPSPSGNSRERVFPIFLTLVWLLVAGFALYGGLAYYRLPLTERPFSELHDLYKPSGLMGHGMGILGSLMMIVGVCTYSIRKRVPALHQLGKLKHWLQFHIFLCTLGPFLVVLHTAFKVGGIISIAFWSMVIVVMSGIFGRYVFAWIPKTVNGEFLTEQTVRSRMEELIRTLQKISGLSQAEIGALLDEVAGRAPGNAFDALLLALRWDLFQRRQERKIAHRLAMVEAPYDERKAVQRLLKDYLTMRRQLALISPFQKLFSYWHILHLPLAGVMFFIMLVHIVVAALFGYAWIF